MKKPVPAPEFEVIGNVPDSALGALARLLLDVADKELAAERDSLDSSPSRPQNERAAEALETPRRL